MTIVRKANWVETRYERFEIDLFRILVARIFLAARSLLDRLHRYLTSPPLGQTRIQSRTRLLSTSLSPRTTASIMTYLESCARVPIIESVYRKRNSRRRFVRSNVIASTSYLVVVERIVAEFSRFFRNETFAFIQRAIHRLNKGRDMREKRKDVGRTGNIDQTVAKVSIGPGTWNDNLCHSRDFTRIIRVSRICNSSCA